MIGKAELKLFALALTFLFFSNGCRTVDPIDARIAEERSQIRNREEPLSIEDLAASYSYPKARNDATALWLDAMMALGPNSSERAKGLPFYSGSPFPAFGTQWPEPELTDRFLESCSEANFPIEFAVRRGGAARYPLDLSSGYGIFLRHNERLRELALFLTFRARYAAHRGHWSAAHEDLRSAISAANSLRKEPFTLSMLARCGMLSLATDDLGLYLERGRWTEAELSDLQQDLEISEVGSHLPFAFRGERVLLLHSYETDGLAIVPRPDLPLEQLRFENRKSLLAYLAFMRELTDFFDRGYPARLSAFQVRFSEIRNRALERAMATEEEVPLFSALIKESDDSSIACYRRVSSVDARLRCSTVALALTRFWKREKRLPESLEELKPAFLSEIPLDPFSNTTIGYRRQGRGFVVYSIGYDGVDDGGRTSLFRLALHDRDEEREEESFWEPDIVLRVAEILE